MAVTSDLNRYQHISRLGAGGMSTVELAEDTLLGRRVALKRVHTPDDVRRSSRLRREALIGASLSHPNLVSIFDIITTDDGEYVIVMEYVEGETLAARLRRGAKAEVPEAIRMLAGVASALDAIHAQNIVHRDVKPGNILLGLDGTVKLADLGIAAVSDRTRITTDGAVLGTFSYMAPEQLEGRLARPSVDIYALAIVAYEALSGQRARKEPNPVALAHAISSQPPPDLRSVWPDAPAAAAEVLVRGMCRDPRGRPRSAGELVGRLKAAFEPETTAPVTVPRRPRPVPVAPPPSVARPQQAAAARPRQAAPPARTTPALQPVRQSHPRGQSDAASPPPGRGPRSRSALIALGGLGLVIAAAAIIVLASSGSSPRGGSTSAIGSGHAAGTKSRGTATAQASASTASGTGAAAGAGAASGNTTPIAAVESFYHLAAGHQYSTAWALADPAFQSQLGGYQSFTAGQAEERSITFDSASVTRQSSASATVYVRTTSVRYNGTQHCYGPVDLVRGTGGWLLHQIDISCV